MLHDLGTLEYTEILHAFKPVLILTCALLGCFRSVFDRQTGASDGQTRVSVVGGQTIIQSIVIKVHVAR